MEKRSKEWQCINIIREWLYDDTYTLDEIEDIVNYMQWVVRGMKNASHENQHKDDYDKYYQLGERLGEEDEQ